MRERGIDIKVAGNIIPNMDISKSKIGYIN